MKFVDALKKHSVEIKDKVAIVDNELENSATYFDIEIMSNKIANKLSKLGFKDNDKIIINLDRSARYFMAELGVLKINATFIPVMSTYPKDRVDYIFNDSKAKYIITKDFFDDIDEFDDSFEPNISYDGLATILYTSGSTGNPKGICWPKKAFDEAIERSDGIFEDIKDIRYGTVAPMTFVVIFTDLFGVLRKGGTTYLIPDAIKNDAKEISKYYVKNKLTCGFLPPRLNKIFEIKSDDLIQINVVGERVSKQYSTEHKILNLYGQTEGWMYTTYLIDKMYDNTPVGKPLPGIEIKILDENGNAVKDGTEGEICAIGLFPYEYNNLPERTEKTFVKQADGRVLIHTGDIGKIDENGNLLYLNRNDFMIKLHGLRVEPGGIENIICSVDGVKNAVAKAYEMDDGTMVFCGFYVADKKIDKSIVKKRLEEKVPTYMIPTILYQMDEFPVNQNGKIDRKNIKMPSIELLKETYEAPVNDIERKICEGFEKLFSLEKVGRNDNFYELGGNSLNSVELSAICDVKNITSSLIMQGMTPKCIAELLQANENKKPEIKKVIKNKKEYKIPNSFLYQYEVCKANDAPMENISANLYYKLSYDIDIERFEKAILDTINENEVYKCGVDIENEKIFIHNDEFKINKISLKEEDFKTYRQNRYKKVVDYKKDFLTEIDIIDVDNKEIYFHFVINHLICDLSSVKIFLMTICKNYYGEKSHEEISIFDVSEYEEAIKSTAFYNEARKYYDSIYGSIGEFDLLKKEKKYTSVSVTQILDDVDENKITEFLKKNRTSYLSYLLLAFEMAVNKLFDKEDFTYINIYNGRLDNSLNTTHGGLAKGVFLRSSYYKSDNNYERLKNLNETYQRILYYDVFDFKNLLNSYKNIRSGILFNYRDSFDLDLKFNNQNIMPSFLEELSDTGIYVDMDIMLNNIGGNKVLIITSTRLSKEELDEFAKNYNDFCHKIVNSL